MDDFNILFYFAFWALFCIGVAYLADKKGRSAIGFFLLSLFFSPIIGLLVVLASGPSTPVASKAAELERLADLKAKGILSDEEFNKAKAKALA